MRVAGKFYLIVAVLQLVAADIVFIGVGIVVRLHILHLHRYGYLLALVGFEQVGLPEARHNNVRLFDAAVVIGRGVVHLHHIFTCNRAGVGHLYRCRYGAVLCKRAALFGALRDELPVERGIGEAVTEGIDDVSVVPVVPFGGGSALQSFLSRIVSLGALGVAARLPVAVADVYALFIVDKGKVGSRT